VTLATPQHHPQTHPTTLTSHTACIVWCNLLLRWPLPSPSAPPRPHAAADAAPAYAAALLLLLWGTQRMMLGVMTLSLISLWGSTVAELRYSSGLTYTTAHTAQHMTQHSISFSLQCTTICSTHCADTPPAIAGHASHAQYSITWHCAGHRPTDYFVYSVVCICQCFAGPCPAAPPPTHTHPTTHPPTHTLPPPPTPTPPPSPARPLPAHSCFPTAPTRRWCCASR
jgi:hypothetical protein